MGRRPKAIQEWMALSREEREALVDAAQMPRANDLEDMTPQRIVAISKLAAAEYPDRNGRAKRTTDDAVDHPAHYGGEDDLYEAIKVIEAWDLGFHLGNAVKYVARAGRKGDALTDLCKARWYLDREIARRQRDGRR